MLSKKDGSLGEVGAHLMPGVRGGHGLLVVERVLSE